ncbi:MAG: DUF5106 domain-containing protein [Bacteroidales bacterium]|jgi:hypothetical protein|nr:DUF5106 domain-containing protein [Bacteroidales bacterium]
MVVTNHAVHRLLGTFWMLLLSGNVCICAAFRMEVSLDSLPHTALFLAGYYGDRITVVDSTCSDGAGRAVFCGSRLPQGLYILTAPGKFRCDFLLAEEQEIRIEIKHKRISVSGNRQTEAYADYLLLEESQPTGQQLNDYREKLVASYPGTFLSAYMSALQPVHYPFHPQPDERTQMMDEYRYRRQHFFDHIDLSDTRLLHTPLYAETVGYYFSQFVTQQADTLISAAYRLLRKASGSCETFFFMMDFLADYSLRAPIEHIERLYHFLQPNRCMLSGKAISMLPANEKGVKFTLPEEENICERLVSVTYSGTNGENFNFSQTEHRFRIFYYWDAACPRCLSDAASWQRIMNTYRSKSCESIAAHICGLPPGNSLLSSFTNIYTSDFTGCERLFLVHDYAKTVLVGQDGEILGIFGSMQALDAFLNQITR